MIEVADFKGRPNVKTWFLGFIRSTMLCPHLWTLQACGAVSNVGRGGKWDGQARTGWTATLGVRIIGHAATAHGHLDRAEHGYSRDMFAPFKDIAYWGV